MDFDDRTTAAVVRFRTRYGAKPDGIVGPLTWALRGKALGYEAATMLPLGDVPPWVRNLLLDDEARTGVKGLAAVTALELYERSAGALTTRQREGLRFLLTAAAARVAKARSRISPGRPDGSPGSEARSDPTSRFSCGDCAVRPPRCRPGDTLARGAR